MKKEIKVLDYANEILNGVKKGVLLTTKNNDFVNSMTISWGTLGIEWNKNIFTVFVRENRYTRTMLDENPYFTINVPLEAIDKNILKVCGTTTGSKLDKIKELNLHLEEGININVPGIKELPLTLECKVIYRQDQDLTKIQKESLDAFYPQNIESDYHGSNKDHHIAYYGEIVNAYIIE